MIIILPAFFKRKLQYNKLQKKNLYQHLQIYSEKDARCFRCIEQNTLKQKKF